MASKDKKKHWGRSGNFLKLAGKSQGLAFFNSEERRRINKETERLIHSI